MSSRPPALTMVPPRCRGDGRAQRKGGAARCGLAVKRRGVTAGREAGKLTKTIAQDCGVQRNGRMANSLRGEVLNLYKNLLYLGREYPKGADYFRSRLKAAFLKNKDVKDPEKIKQLIARGEFVIKELEALYFLRKYRAMKQRYYDDKE
ncbi:electron transfer flavoprotein regulatory factor 1 isoform X1 [Anser cygnoides]|uniref:electron transfer flavoprotein regulatory factor 1 isoform X1 n=1 Tax=Anser cygnoides TaxID=8845 RepID=UPI0034D304E7